MTTPSKSNDTPSKQGHTQNKQTPASTQGTPAEHPNPITALQEDEPVASPAPSSVLQMPFTPGRTPNKNRGMAFSLMTFTTSPAQSNMGPNGRTTMSRPSRARSDLGSARKLRLVNEQEELEGDIDVNTADNQVVIWGTDVHVNECKRRFISFLKKFHLNVEEANLEGVDPTKPFYMQKLEEVHLLERPFLNVDCLHIKQIDKRMYHQLLIYPEEVISIFDIAVNGLFLTIYEDDKLPHQIEVRPYNVDMFKNMRCLNPEDIDKLVTFAGMVIGSSLIMAEMRSAYFSCNRCDFYVQVEIDNGRIDEPTLCTSCNTTHSFQLIPNLSLFADKQFIKLHEIPEEMPAGQTPVTVTVVSHNDLVDAVQPGDRIQVTGIFRAVPVRINPKTRNVRSVYRTFIDVIHFRRQKIFTAEGGIEGQLTSDDEESSSSKFSKERLAQFRNLSERPDIYELLSNAIAPNIFVREDIKKGILLQLFGGTKKNFTDAGRKTFRSEINILLCGDPGTAKSQFQQYIFRLVPRAQYINGKGTSDIGLTAYVTKDPETGQLFLQASALVLADNGICCIDQLDKMNESGRSILHEIMEQQTLSIAKAGIKCTLNARTSILAAANPIESQWNKSKTIIENIQLPPKLLSHFDFIFLLLDPQDEIYDRLLAKHLFSQYQYGEEDENAHEAINTDLLRDYISYARTFVSPQLTELAGKLLVRSYVEMRKVGSGEGQISAHPRQLESLIRLAEAHAKVRLSDKVQEFDVEEAKRLYRRALKESSINPETGRVDIPILTMGTVNNKSRPFINVFEHLEVATTREQLKELIGQIYGLIDQTEANIPQRNMRTEDQYSQELNAKLEQLKSSKETIVDRIIAFLDEESPHSKVTNLNHHDHGDDDDDDNDDDESSAAAAFPLQPQQPTRSTNIQTQQPTSSANTEPQQQQQVAPTISIDTGSSSPSLTSPMMQNSMSQLVQISRLRESVFNALYMLLLMDSLAGNPDIPRQMFPNNPEIQALMQNQEALIAITQIQEGLRRLHAAAPNLLQALFYQ